MQKTIHNSNSARDTRNININLLVGWEDINGRAGVATSFDQSRDRYVVVFPALEGAGGKALRMKVK